MEHGVGVRQVVHNAVWGPSGQTDIRRKPVEEIPANIRNSACRGEYSPNDRQDVGTIQDQFKCWLMGTAYNIMSVTLVVTL